MTASQKYIEKLNKEYIENHIREQERDELIKENNVEKRDIKGYHGREILELLQNADDAYQKSIDEDNKPNEPLEVVIEFKNNILSVSNTGTYFDNDGIKAIVQGNNSQKSGKYIGNKGTGFRSVLNWADKIRIFSGDFNLEFSKEIASEKLNEIKSKPQIEKQIRKNPSLYIPILSIPKYIETNIFYKETKIEITVNQNKLNDGFGAQEQIENIDMRILLFLPNVSKIKIETEKENMQYERTISTKTISNRAFKTVALRKISNEDTIVYEESFYLFEKNIKKAIEEESEKKDIRLAIAVPIDYSSFKCNYLYSFFPLLDTESPFDCVMHASYVLGDQRNTLINGEINKTIICQQLSFIKDIAEKFTSPEFDDLAIRLITPIKSSNDNIDLGTTFSKFKIENEFLFIFKISKVLQTVNGDYISLIDNPKLFETDFPKFFRGKYFRYLLKTINEHSRIFIKTVAHHFSMALEYEESNLMEIINNITSSYDKLKQIELFIWWNEKFDKTLPNLLKNQNDEWIKYHEECYFLVGNIDKGTPSWTKILSINIDYQKKLLDLSEKQNKIQEIRKSDRQTHISRLISQNNLYPLVRFSYRDRYNIITTINSSVDTYEKSIEFIKWLWDNYKNELNEWTPPKGSNDSTVNYNFPNLIKNSILSSNKLFMGSEYKNILSEKLFDNSYGKFPGADIFDVNIQEINKFTTFIQKFGVNIFPKVEKMEVQPMTAYKKRCESLINKSEGRDPNDSITITYKLPYIDGLDKILISLKTEDIINWIHNDNSIRSYLSNPFYLKDITLNYKWSQLWYERNYNGQVSNYILFVFNHSKWIEINDIRYAPIEILWAINSKSNPKFSELVPVFEDSIVINIAKKIKTNYNAVTEVMRLFSFCEKVTDLPSNNFYELLLLLPKYDFQKSVDMSKAIYRIIEQTEFSRKYEETDNKRKFFNEGELLVKFQGKLQYYKANEAYLPSSKIIIKKETPIIEKNQRTGNENFVKVFSCLEYSKEYEIVNEQIILSDNNAEFQEYYKEFSKYARAYDENNKNIENNAFKLSIKLVKHITIKENNILNDVSIQYTALRDTQTQWYVTVFDNTIDYNKLSEQIEIIYTNIANTPGYDASKIGELFRTRNKSDREFLIKKDFNSLDVISDGYYENQLKNNFIETVKKIIQNYNIINIDFEYFNSITNTPNIIKLLKDIDCDIDKFEYNGFVYPIDLIPYYKSIVKKYIRDEKIHFINYNYFNAKNNLSLQNDFIKTIDEFENYDPEYQNSIYFDFKSKIISKFGEWKDVAEINADESYSLNYDLLNPKNKFKDEISNNNKVRTMIFFNKKEEFESWFDSQLNNEEKTKANGKNDIYEKYLDIIPEKMDITFHDIPNLIAAGIEKPRGSYVQTSDEKRRKAQKELGNKGELIIYNLLCDRFGIKNVFPKSEAFVEIGILKPGQASSGEYDILYKDDLGEEYFAEVKTGDGTSFYITPNELKFAKENPAHYKLFIVSGINETLPKYQELPLEFWNDTRFKLKSIIERIEVKF
jgi:hypothetical protein